MGVCCQNCPTNEMPLINSEIFLIRTTLDDKFFQFKQLSQEYRKNPFHNYSSKRQIYFLSKYIQFYHSTQNPKDYYYSKPIEEYLSQNNFPNNFIRDILYVYDLIQNNNLLSFFIEPDVTFLQILIYLMSRTRNNTLTKIKFTQEIIDGLFKSKDNGFNCVKHVIWNIIQIVKEMIAVIVMNYDKEMINDYLNEGKIDKIWGEYIMKNIDYAGYSNVNNMDKFNIIITNDIATRLMWILDSRCVLYSFVYSIIRTDI